VDDLMLAKIREGRREKRKKEKEREEKKKSTAI
jgi:hypothetical protein